LGNCDNRPVDSPRKGDEAVNEIKYKDAQGDGKYLKYQIVAKALVKKCEVITTQQPNNHNGNRFCELFYIRS